MWQGHKGMSVALVFLLHETPKPQEQHIRSLNAPQRDEMDLVHLEMEPFSGQVDLSKTAVLIIDMQVGFTRQNLFSRSNVLPTMMIRLGQEIAHLL